MTEQTTINEDSTINAFLIHAAMLLHRYGTPSHRLERVMSHVASSLGVEAVFLYTPTALVISIKNGEAENTVVRRVETREMHVDKLFQADDILAKLERKQITLKIAATRLREIDQASATYPFWVSAIACAIGCGAIAALFRGSPAEVLAAAVIGMLTAVIERIADRYSREASLIHPAAGFVAAILSLAYARFIVPIDDRLVTLAGLIVLIPGLTLTVALTELAVGHLSAGVARLAGAVVTLFTLLLGAAIAWQFAQEWRDIPEKIIAPESWMQWIALLVAPIAFAIIFQARLPQWPVIFAVSMLGILVSRSVGPKFGAEVASFSAALAVGCGSNLYARMRGRPALIAMTPAMIVLVPGSFGYRSLIAMLDHETIAGIEIAFYTIMIAMCLVGGLLMSNAVVPPRRVL
ncbi:hypothetical protein Pla52o_43640 [Novipirellula galeiformis]|uniref:Inner membrane protein YjjP n=1 Tax=Novipirellula galeiformis TaxID=2528004 RepID=A0A5C6CAS7_9BACT|nr:threonine/serine exporter family protein [Novipirellula galeiformis]TWU20486.1 hypothetical protein Pla52o_43640 [Novipirellula galeiformis]